MKKTFKQAMENAQAVVRKGNLGGMIVTLSIVKRSTGKVYVSQFIYEDGMSVEAFKSLAIKNIWEGTEHNIEDVDIDTPYTVICK